MTAMRSDMTSASSWSWVMKSVVSPRRRCRRRTSSLHLLAQLAVERAERLVEQQQPRLEHGGAGQRDALLLAAGELVGQALGHAGELDHVQRLLRPALAISAFAMPRIASG